MVVVVVVLVVAISTRNSSVVSSLAVIMVPVTVAMFTRNVLAAKPVSTKQLKLSPRIPGENTLVYHCIW